MSRPSSAVSPPAIAEREAGEATGPWPTNLGEGSGVDEDNAPPRAAGDAPEAAAAPAAALFALDGRGTSGCCRSLEAPSGPSRAMLVPETGCRGGVAIAIGIAAEGFTGQDAARGEDSAAGIDGRDIGGRELLAAFATASTRLFTLACGRRVFENTTGGVGQGVLVGLPLKWPSRLPMKRTQTQNNKQSFHLNKERRTQAPGCCHPPHAVLLVFAEGYSRSAKRGNGAEVG